MQPIVNILGRVQHMLYSLTPATDSSRSFWRRAVAAVGFESDEQQSSYPWSLMKIESITLREIRMRLKSPFETSFGTVQDRRIVLVEVLADGVSGWGEVTAGETPAYNA